MTNLDRALRDCVQVFERLGTPYAVMGGLAVRIYGIPRATFDIDVTLAIDRDRLDELFQSLEELGFTVGTQYAAGWVDQVAGLPLVKAKLCLAGEGIDIDIFLAESPFQEQLLARRRRVECEGLRIFLVSPEDLLLLKLVSHRPRDLVDIADVLLMQGQLDEAYLRHWAGRLGVLDRLEAVLAQ